jgi:hypothetical protein
MNELDVVFENFKNKSLELAYTFRGTCPKEIDNPSFQNIQDEIMSILWFLFKFFSVADKKSERVEIMSIIEQTKFPSSFLQLYKNREDGFLSITNGKFEPLGLLTYGNYDKHNLIYKNFVLFNDCLVNIILAHEVPIFDYNNPDPFILFDVLDVLEISTCITNFNQNIINLINPKTFEEMYYYN